LPDGWCHEPAVPERQTAVAEGDHCGGLSGPLGYYERTDGVHIVEISPQMCAQFADLVESVNGTNTYEILFAASINLEEGGDSRR
jgi:hypothetical protein